MNRSYYKVLTNNSASPVILFCLIMLLSVFSSVTAKDNVPTPSPDEVNLIARQIYPPTGGNVPLSECTSSACEQWQQLIREQLMMGWDEDQILAYFAEQYGDYVLAKPSLSGFNGLVYILPALTTLLVAFVVYRTLSKRKPASLIPAGEGPDNDDPFEAIFEEQLKDYENRYHRKPEE